MRPRPDSIVNTAPWFASVLLAVLAAPAYAQIPVENLGGPDESCRARTDCKPGLKCVGNKCMDPHEGESCAATPDCGTQLKCIDKRCVSPNAPTSPPAESHPAPQHERPPPRLPERVKPRPNEDEARNEAAWRAWLQFPLTGLHPFVGLSVGLGAVNGGYTGASGSLWGTGADAAFDLAIRGGIFVNHHELALEISPFTYIWDFQGLGQTTGPAFKVDATYAYFVQLTHGDKVRLYYPLRGGLGSFLGGANTGNNVFVEARADLVGMAMKVGHVMIDLHAPSFRYALTNGNFAQLSGLRLTQHLLTWVFGLSASYVF
jgi:hypothetical protein